MAERIAAIKTTSGLVTNVIELSRFDPEAGRIVLHGIADVPQDVARSTPDGDLASAQAPEPYPLVILMHGLGSTCRSEPIEELGHVLAARGIPSLRFDFMGHGESTGALRDMTIPGEVLDAELVLSWAQTLPWVARIGIAGHSQGGLVAAMLAARHPSAIASMALLAPAVHIFRHFQDVCDERGWAYGPNPDPSTAPDETLDVRGCRLGSAYATTAASLDPETVCVGYENPVLILQGTDDDAVPPESSRELQRLYNTHQSGLPACDLLLVEGAGHSFYQHEPGIATEDGGEWPVGAMRDDALEQASTFFEKTLL
jgi:pimeloyl-ACP methyl ester carboxylesterase